MRRLGGSVGAFLFVCALAAGGVAGAGTMQVRDFDARVLPAGGQAFERAPWPSHRIAAGDRVQFIVLICHDATIRNVRISFQTTAPITGYQPAAPNAGTFTANNPPEPCGFTHTLWGGVATFTTAGHYQITFSATADGAGPASRTFDLVIEERVHANLPPGAVLPPHPVLRCAAPAVQIMSPTAATGVCLDRLTHVSAQVTVHECAPYTLTVTVRRPDGTTQVLPAVTSAPWSVTFTPTLPGNYAISAEIRDHNGTSSTATVNVTANRCPTVPFVQPKH